MKDIYLFKKKVYLPKIILILSCSHQTSIYIIILWILNMLLIYDKF